MNLGLRDGNVQTGVETLTNIPACGSGLIVELMLGMKPVSKAPLATQGEVKADVVAVWFCSANSKTTMSPMFAVMELGVKTFSVPPTVTLLLVSHGIVPITFD